MKLSLSIISIAGANVKGSKIISLTNQGASIGRKDDNALVLPDPNRYVSGHHALIEYRPPDFFIKDTSANGVLINDAKTPLGNGNSLKLNDGDLLTMGDYIIEVKIEGDFFGSAFPQMSPFPDNQINNLNDPFADLDTDSVQNMIDKNDFIPSNWRDSREKPIDPFDFQESPLSDEHSQEKTDSPQRDYDHISPYKEAFSDFQKETKGLTDSKPASNISADIFSEDWYQANNISKQEGSEPASPTDIKPVKPEPAFIEPAPVVPVDIFSEDWFQPGNISQKIEPETPATTDTKPQLKAEILPSKHAQPRVEDEHVKIEIPSPEIETTPGEYAEELIQNFLRGAHLDPGKFRQSINPETLLIAGTILRAAIQGTMDVLIGRAKIKNEMHLDVTIIRPKQNNPIKFSVSTDEALAKLLFHEDMGYMPPKEAVEEAFDDLRAHQYSVIAGMQTALLTVLKRFDPQKLEERLQRLSPISASIPIHKQAKLWDLFEQLYEEIQQEAEDNFYSLFGQAFAETYEKQMQKLKSSKRDSSLK